MIKHKIIHKNMNKLLILVFVFSMTFVLASNVNEASASSSTIYVNNSGGNDSWNGESAVWNGTDVGPKKSIKNATGTVTENGTVFVEEGTYTGKNNANITIDKNMSIIGQNMDHTIINGTDGTVIFVIDKGLNVIIKDLTITNCTTTTGTVVSAGNLTVQDCYFAHNKANGGTAITNNGNLNVDDSYFYENVGNNLGKTITGGAIANRGTMSVDSTTFLKNSGTSGGAIFAYGNSTFSDTTFTDNSALLGGGAIFSYGNSTATYNLDVANCTFTNNNINGKTESIMGGAIVNMGTFTLTYSTFTNNNATSLNATYGGAIANIGNMVAVSCNFNKNIATNTATAKTYYSMGGAISNFGILTLDYCNFTGNSVFDKNQSGIGGAIYNDYFMYIEDFCTFNGNTADVGGAITNDGNMTLEYGNFINNTVKTGDGGAISNYGSCSISNQTSFTGNYAEDGGAINNDGQLTLSNSSFDKNIGTLNYSMGGAIYNLKGTSATPILISNCTFNNNTSTRGGGIYNAGDVKLINSNFTDNTALITTGKLAYDGGAVCNNGNLTVSSTSFIGNKANLGGAISNGGNSTVMDSIFKDNGATYYGDAIFIHGKTSVHFCDIVGNQLPGKRSNDIYVDAGSANILYNWWGSNSGPSSGRVVGTTSGPWLVLTVTSSKLNILPGETANITANLLYDSDGVYHDPTSGHVPNGILVSFTSNIGTITNQTATNNGTANAILNSGSTGGPVYVTAKLDSQTVQSPPKVTSTYPTNGTVKFSRTSEISIEFNENIKASINWSEICVKDLSTGKIVTITKSIVGNTLDITTLKRSANNKYLVYIPASAVKDYSSNHLTTEYSFEFTTGT